MLKSSFSDIRNALRITAPVMTYYFSAIPTFLAIEQILLGLSFNYEFVEMATSLAFFFAFTAIPTAFAFFYLRKK